MSKKSGRSVKKNPETGQMEYDDAGHPGLQDSGEREPQGTGAVRDTRSGKGRFDLISPHGLFRLARIYELDAEKYEDRNWEKGIAISRCLDSAKRHLNQYAMGAKDEDHLAQAAWNLFAIMHFETCMPEMQDIPTRKEVDKK